jgi:hypothetical protein
MSPADKYTFIKRKKNLKCSIKIMSYGVGNIFHSNILPWGTGMYIVHMVFTEYMEVSYIQIEN